MFNLVDRGIGHVDIDVAEPYWEMLSTFVFPMDPLSSTFHAGYS
jgi:hypothetical protein